jgi:DNA processing protein
MHKPYSFDFPSRNRIMVGIADAVLVIEAGDKSGTLITARLASEYNRDLMCVPHRIGDPHGFGAHLFIRLGAALVTDPVHVLEALGIAAREGVDERLAARHEGAEKHMYEALAEPLARDEAIRAVRLPAGEALTALVSLELKGLIREEFGLWRRL